ncbi:hypothetical protein [Anaerocolumna sp.]|uniref:hypothetical protein n=1 Tax=Anaerocolumna sp. TaxID=2041569 RepID=UPI0028B0C5F7|nr:hypothetical protein [Anaerocolumna sp.]
MKKIAKENIIIRTSFKLPFSGSEIWGRRIRWIEYIHRCYNREIPERYSDYKKAVLSKLNSNPSQ